EAFLREAARRMRAGERLMIAFDSSTAEGTYRTVRLPDGRTGLYYGGGPGEHDNNALLLAAQRARDLA
ncbi:MAG TPA: hypothetical protein PKJ97_04505, partial [Candidatus Bilamarchaeaceae archaeon]|nr:hypothetical protein [Candidatus Bilamarchaeaceae archaeon]